MTPNTREEAVKQAYDKGYAYEHEYHGCSQCVLLALGEALGAPNDDVLKAAGGLSGGIGMMADTCGALLGASMMLGLRYGRSREEIADMEKLRQAGMPVAELYKWFQQEFGSATCREIRTRFGNGVFYDFTDPEQKAKYEELDILGKCSDLVGRAAAKVTEMLWDEVQAEKK